MYIPPKTKDALAKRALSLANLMERWQNQFKDEMKKQNVDLWDAPDEPDSMEIPRHLVRRMIDEMAEAKKSIRQLEVNVQKGSLRFPSPKS
jgi:hypothetical protein